MQTVAVCRREICIPSIATLEVCWKQCGEGRGVDSEKVNDVDHTAALRILRGGRRQEFVGTGHLPGKDALRLPLPLLQGAQHRRREAPWSARPRDNRFKRGRVVQTVCAFFCADASAGEDFRRAGDLTFEHELTTEQEEEINGFSDGAGEQGDKDVEGDERRALARKTSHRVLIAFSTGSYLSTSPAEGHDHCRQMARA